MRSSREPRRVWLAAATAIVLSLAADAAGQPRNCSTVSQNLYLRDLLQDIYYWNTYLPNPDPARFASPEAYLEAVRYKVLDSTFSYITTKAATDAFYSDSQFIGFGLSTQVTSSAAAGIEMHVSQVFPDSPAAQVGLARGDRILAIGGRSVADWYAAGQLGSAFGPADIGVTRTVRFQRGEEAPTDGAMTKRLVTIPTVSDVQILDRDGVKVGYIFLRNFVEPSKAALDDAFVAMQAAGVRELVLDLRYNGGGLVSVAQHLASLIGGTRTGGQVLAEYVHNQRNANRNQVLRFEQPPAALSLERLFVIATRSSASASELLINVLRPYLPVIVVGESTYGKPVGQYGFEFCDNVAYPVAFSLRNATGDGDYFGGIPPTCAAPDDLGHALGDPGEASLAETLHVIDAGECSAVATVSRTRRATRIFGHETGFQQLTGAW